jgi:hypothetical protein
MKLRVLVIQDDVKMTELLATDDVNASVELRSLLDRWSEQSARVAAGQAAQHSVDGVPSAVIRRSVSGNLAKSLEIHVLSNKDGMDAIIPHLQTSDRFPSANHFSRVVLGYKYNAAAIALSNAQTIPMGQDKAPKQATLRGVTFCYVRDLPDVLNLHD